MNVTQVLLDVAWYAVAGNSTVSTSDSMYDYHKNEYIDMKVLISCGIGSLLGSFAAAIGIGGGAIYVPLYMIIAGIEATQVVPRSSATQLGLGLANYAFNFSRRHPKREGPLIEYDVILAMMPLLMAGTAAGVLVNKSLPEWLAVSLLATVVGFATYRAYLSAFRLYKRENQEKNVNKVEEQKNLVESKERTVTSFSVPSQIGFSTHQLDNLPANDQDSELWGSGSEEENEDSTLLYNMSFVNKTFNEDRPVGERLEPSPDQGESYFFSRREPESINASPGYISSVHERYSYNDGSVNPALLAKIDKAEKRTIPWEKIALLLVIELGIFAYPLIRNPPPGLNLYTIAPCSTAYYSITAAVLPYFLFLAVLISIYLVYTYRRKLKAGYMFLETDVKWTSRNVLIFPLLGLFSGIAAGALGISSATILGPILLGFGIIPYVVTATTAMMIIFVQSSILAQFLILGNISWRVAGVFFATGVTASLLGQLVLIVKNKVSKRESALALLMATVILFCLCSLVGVGVWRIVSNPQQQWKFKPLCPGQSENV